MDKYAQTYLSNLLSNLDSTKSAQDFGAMYNPPLTPENSEKFWRPIGNFAHQVVVQPFIDSKNDFASVPGILQKGDYRAAAGRTMSALGNGLLGASIVVPASKLITGPIQGARLARVGAMGVKAVEAASAVAKPSVLGRAGSFAKNWLNPVKWVDPRNSRTFLTSAELERNGKSLFNSSVYGSNSNFIDRAQNTALAGGPSVISPELGKKILETPVSQQQNLKPSLDALKTMERLMSKPTEL